MFHNVLMTTLAPMQDTTKINGWQNRAITIWPDVNLEKSKDINIKKTIKKKKRNRTMFTTEQVRVLEKVFARSKYIDVERRKEISECLQIDQKCVKIWFQNRRMKEKKELSESESATESQVSLESVSPPLQSPQPSSGSNGCSLPEVRHTTQYYYNTPYNFVKEDVQQDESYEVSSNPIIPDYFYYNNNLHSNLLRANVNYSAQYYPPRTEFQDYYNTGENNSPYITSNIRDWPANLYDTSYF